ncbi:BTB POZ domain-containing POB1 [Paramuricea clavata]|uniref:BTB POZ domain-containing POB1 n=1 Tax=Paramuricea clavata TaxID=317549 RepID=A0A7D9LGB3_PARCT|nr:BTB POZ domain-containing POB1 [Paramuricea clavata]
MSNFELSRSDLLELCASEYNMPELSDRVLVFDVMHEGWGTTRLLENILTTAPNEVTASGEYQGNELQQSEDLNDPLSDSLEKSNTPVLHRIPERLLRQHKIYVHSFWLSIHSSYFRSLFHSSGMKENQEKQVHMKISELEENAHLVLIEAIYRDDVLGDKTADEQLAVLELASKYDLKFVFKKCKYILQTNPIPFEISTKIMHVINVKHNMNDVGDLVEILQPILVKEFSPLDENWQSDKFTSLSEVCLEYVLSSDDLIVASENTVFHALMYWMEQNDVDPASLEETNDLLAVVRYKLVAIDYLYNVIKNHPIASKMPKFSEFYHGGLTYHALPSEQKKLFQEKPVTRKKPEGPIIQHTFVVEEEDFKTAVENGSELNSEKFWACGYRISVGIQPSSNDILYPYMIVHNLNRESYVPLKFTFLKERETQINYCPWKEKAFKANSCRENYLRSFTRGYFGNTIHTLYVAVTLQ